MAGAVKLTIKGDKELIRDLKKLMKQAPDVVGDVIEEEGHKMFAESVREVPVKHGNLRASGFVRRQKQDTVVGYGTEYAAAVHERTELNHKPPTKAKFLQDPFNRMIKGYFGRLAKQVASKLGIR